MTFMLRGKFQFGFYLIHIILPEMLYTIIASLAVYPVALLLNRFIERLEGKEAYKFV